MDLKELFQKTISNIKSILIIALVLAVIFFAFKSSIFNSKVDQLTVKLTDAINKQGIIRRQVQDSLQELELKQRDSTLVFLIKQYTDSLKIIYKQQSVIYENYKKTAANYSSIILNRPKY